MFFFCKFKFIIKLFTAIRFHGIFFCQCLPKQYENQANQAMSNLANIHQILVSLGVKESEIATIYENIAAILHLGNIKFDISDSGTQIIESTKEHVTIAAKLMKILPAELESAILFRLIEVAGSTIR